MRTGLLLTITLVAGSFPTSLAQSQSSQPVDPTAQAPSTVAPTTPSSNQEKERIFLGTIVKRRHGYVLKAADAEYPLDDQGEAKKYKGKRVKVSGNLDESHTIRVKMIQLSPPV
jgi:hypothetical protein